MTYNELQQQNCNILSYLFLGTTNIIWLLASSFVLLFLLNISQATSPRFRVDQGAKFLAFMLILAVIELIRVVFFILLFIHSEISIGFFQY